MLSKMPLILVILAATTLVGGVSPAVFAAQAAHSASSAAVGRTVLSKQTPDAAGVKGFSSTYLSCHRSAGDNLLQNDGCISAELKYQDTRLNRIYKALLATLKPVANKALVVAERAWLKSASGDEAFETSLYGDSQAENAQQYENRLMRLCARANALDKYLAFASL